MSAILFGSISSVADTSEMQREAFNAAFAEHDLPWRWDRDYYVTMLGTAGGKERIAEQARSAGVEVDAAAVHQTKSRLFQQRLAGAPVPPRTGVVETIDAARKAGMKVGLVTTTLKANVDALLSALAPTVQPSDFDIVVDVTDVSAPKPDGGAYSFALAQLAEKAEACVAIEDNADGVRAATAAGVTCIAFPNQNTAGSDLGSEHVVDRLRFDEVAGLIPAA